MNRKRKRQTQILTNGWYWYRLFVNLRGGCYHYRWQPALVEDGGIRLWGSDAPIPLDAPILKNVLWSGPIEPPPLDDEHRTALALEQAATRLKPETWRLRPTDEDEIDPGQIALAVAEAILEAFLSTVDSLRDYYREHAEHRIELVEKMASLIEQAFRSK